MTHEIELLWICKIFVPSESSTFLSFLYRLIYLLCACVCVRTMKFQSCWALRRPRYTKCSQSWIQYSSHRTSSSSPRVTQFIKFQYFHFSDQGCRFLMILNWIREREIHLWWMLLCGLRSSWNENNNLNNLRQSTNFFHLWSSSDECDVTDSDWIVNSQHFVTCSNSDFTLYHWRLLHDNFDFLFHSAIAIIFTYDDVE